VTENNGLLSTSEDKRGGYSGSMDAANVPPPAKIPSASMPKDNGKDPEK
jgi:hypothetical protein